MELSQSKTFPGNKDHVGTLSLALSHQCNPLTSLYQYRNFHAGGLITVHFCLPIGTILLKRKMKSLLNQGPGFQWHILHCDRIENNSIIYFCSFVLMGLCKKDINSTVFNTQTSEGCHLNFKCATVKWIGFSDKYPQCFLWNRLWMNGRGVDWWLVNNIQVINYLSQCWPRSRMPYDVRHQWVTS